MKINKLLRFLSITIVISLTLISSFAIDQGPERFPDYDPNAWHAQALTYAVDNNIMHGTNAGRLEPNRIITRAEFVTMIDRLFKTYNVADISMYTDMKESDWHYNNIAMGVQMGTIAGYEDLTMKPNGYITREQAMVIIARTLTLDNGTKSDLKKFKDADQIGDWAIPYIAAMVKDGRAHGFLDGTLRPKDYITRAQTAQLLMNCFPNLINASNITGVYDKNVVLSGEELLEINNASFNDTLILGVGLADGRVNIKYTNINKLICWGSHDVYIYQGCSVNEIIISRTDGPCIIHWMGDRNNLPNVVFRDKSDDECKVVDKNGNQILPKLPSDSENTGNIGNTGGETHYPVVYFDAQNGKSVVSKRIDTNGKIQPIETPTKDGYIFGGWYLDKECDRRFSFTQKATDGMYLYGRWYTPSEYEEVQRLNDIVNGASARVYAETDILATVNADTITCNIYSDAGNTKPLKVELVRKDTGDIIAVINRLMPGDTATVMNVIGSMPSYGNYEAKIVVTPEGETGHFDIEAMLYVAYMWNRGDV